MDDPREGRAIRGSLASRLRPVLWVVAIGAALAVWLLQGGRVRLDPAEEASPAGSLELLAVDGKVIELERLRGQVVLVNLWAEWCGPCRTEIPRLNRLAADYRDRGLVVLGVNGEGHGRQRLAELGRSLGIEYSVALPARPLEGRFRPSGVIPQIWLIDRQGRMRASITGLASERGLRRACEQLLAEPDG